MSDYHDEHGFKLKETKRDRLPAVEELTHTTRLKQAYCQAFRKAYGDDPVVGADEGLILSSLLHTFREEHLTKLIEHYLGMQTKWFVDNAHSLKVLKKDINQVIASYSHRLRQSKGGSLRLMPQDQWLAHYLEVSPMWRANYGVAEKLPKEEYLYHARQILLREQGAGHEVVLTDLESLVKAV